MLDSNVIYSRVLHELFGRLGSQERRFEILWSDELIAEAHRVIRDQKPMPDEAARRWVGLLPAAFPGGRVHLRSVGADVDLASLTRDPDDEHVCALAIAGAADVLFTFDLGFGFRSRGYLKVPLERHGVRVLAPDEFLAADIDENPQMYERVIVAQAAAWGGGRPVDELLEAFDRAQVPRMAARAREFLGVSEP